MAIFLEPQTICNHIEGTYKLNLNYYKDKYIYNETLGILQIDFVYQQFICHHIYLHFAQFILNHVSQFLFPQCTDQYINANVNNRLKNEILILKGVTHHRLGRFDLFQQVRLLCAKDDVPPIDPALLGNVIPMVLFPLSS